jgi:hypothetical protein
VVQTPCGERILTSQVSAITAQLAASLAARRQRPSPITRVGGLGQVIPYGRFIDAEIPRDPPHRDVPRHHLLGPSRCDLRSGATRCSMPGAPGCRSPARRGPSGGPVNECGSLPVHGCGSWGVVLQAIETLGSPASRTRSARLIGIRLPNQMSPTDRLELTAREQRAVVRVMYAGLDR